VNLIYVVIHSPRQKTAIARPQVVFYCLKQIVQSNNATNKAKKETIKQAQHLDDGCGVAVMAAVGSERRGQIR